MLCWLNVCDVWVCVCEWECSVSSIISNTKNTCIAKTQSIVFDGYDCVCVCVNRCFMCVCEWCACSWDHSSAYNCPPRIHFSSVCVCEWASLHCVLPSVHFWRVIFRWWRRTRDRAQLMAAIVRLQITLPEYRRLWVLLGLLLLLLLGLRFWWIEGARTRRFRTRDRAQRLTIKTVSQKMCIPKKAMDTR